MKKMVAILIVCTAFLGSVFADVTFGVKAGGGLTNPSQFIFDEWGIPDEFQKNTFNFMGGIFVDYPLNNVFSIESGIYYAPRSLKIEYLYENYHDYQKQNISWRSTCDIEMKMSYLEIPMLLKIHTDVITPYAGISAAILLGNDGIDYITTGTGYDQDGTINYDNTNDISASNIKDCLNSLVFNAQMGLQYNLTDSIVIDIRYVLGLSAIEKYYEISEAENNRLQGLTEKERNTWYNEHPFRYDGTVNTYEDTESISLSSLYLMVGYQF